MKVVQLVQIEILALVKIRLKFNFKIATLKEFAKIKLHIKARLAHFHVNK